jgi:DNA-binding NtrC family response regulator
MARFIHNHSKRKGKQFISINCAAIPENLLESELFGHEKGAFTGAVARRIGKFEEASGGTLLLDEISEMHPLLQAKLLRAIQEREIDRVGGSKPVPIDIRIIATSNRDLEEAVRNKDFREDLYFRLNVVPLVLPPLRERPMDIEKLAHHFLAKYTQANALPLRALSDQAKLVLRQHQWKGNIRELENTMHRSVLLASGDFIEADVLLISGVKTPESIAKTPKTPMATDRSEAPKATEDTHVNPNILVGRSISDVEQDLIIGTVSHCLGNRTQAANILGISIRTLRNKLRAYTASGVTVPSPGQGVWDMDVKKAS